MKRITYLNKSNYLVFFMLLFSLLSYAQTTSCALSSDTSEIIGITCNSDGTFDVSTRICFGVYNDSLPNPSRNHCGFFVSFLGANIIANPNGITTVQNTNATIGTNGPVGGLIQYGNPNCGGGPIFIVQDSATSVTECFTLTFTLDDYPDSINIGGMEGNNCQTGFLELESPISISNIFSTADTCPMNNGTASASIIGGYPPYTYVWTDTTTGVNVSFDSLAINLSASTYQLVVSSGGCTDTAIVTVELTNVPEIDTFDVTAATCSGLDGSATVQLVAGTGTGPFSFNWFTLSGIPIGATQTINGLDDGTYIVTVLNADGICGVVDTVVVPVMGNELSFGAASITNAGCGLTNGSAAFPIIGGTGPFIFEWANALDPTTVISIDSILNNVSSGTYILRASNFDSDCPQTEFVQIIITGGGPVIDSVQIVNATCGVSNNGSATVFVTEGDSTIYVWENTANPGIPISITNSIIDQDAGTYIVYVDDTTHNCPDSLIVIINNDDNGIIIDQLISTTAKCDSFNGTATVSISQGIGPFIFIWENMNDVGVTISTDSIAINLDAGDYRVYVYDSSQNCPDTAIVTVALEAAPTIDNLVITSENCGEGDGSAQLFLFGGIQPYIIKWINYQGDSIGNNIIQNNLIAGNYTVYVSNNDGTCSSSTNFNVDVVPSVIIDSIDIVQAGCDSTNGMASISVSGGVVPYHYVWENSVNAGATISTNSFANNLSAGLYHVTVTNANGACPVDTSILIAPKNGGSVVDVELTNADCNVPTGSISITVSPDTLNYLYYWTDANGDTVSTQANPTNLEAATYIIKMTLTDSTCAFSQSVTLEENPSSSIISFHTNPTCINTNNGWVSTEVQGDSSQYAYVWTNSDGGIVTTDSIAQGLSAGEYILTVSNLDGSCPTSAPFTIEVADDILTPVFPFVFPTDCGVDNGEALIHVFDGNLPISYKWFTPSGELFGEDSIALNMPAGNGWTLQVEDYVGCEFSQQFDIADSDGPTLNAHSDQTIDIGDTAVIYIDTPYTGVLSWSPQININCLNCPLVKVHPFQTTTYYVTIVDSTACSYTDSVIIRVNVLPKGIFIPNAFTPNGDNLNEIIYLNGFGVKEVSYFRIYDGLGEKVYEAIDIPTKDGIPGKVGWDGTFQGKVLNSDVFVYTVEVIYLDNTTEYLTGHIQLFR